MIVASYTTTRAPACATIQLTADAEGRFSLAFIEGQHRIVQFESASEVQAFDAFSSVVAAHLRYRGAIDAVGHKEAHEAHPVPSFAASLPAKLSDFPNVVGTAPARALLRHAPDPEERTPAGIINASDVIAAEVLDPAPQPDLRPHRQFDIPENPSEAVEEFALVRGLATAEDTAAIEPADLAPGAEPMSAVDPATGRVVNVFLTGSKDLYTAEDLAIADVVVAHADRGGGKRGKGRLVLVESRAPGHPFIAAYFVHNKDRYRYLGTSATREVGVADFKRRQARLVDEGKVF